MLVMVEANHYLTSGSKTIQNCFFVGSEFSIPLETTT